MPIKIDYNKCCWKDGKCSGKKADSKAKSGCSCCCTSSSNSCNGCVEACATEALVRKKKVEFDSSKCIDCGACIAACPHEAISFTG